MTVITLRRSPELGIAGQRIHRDFIRRRVEIECISKRFPTEEPEPTNLDSLLGCMKGEIDDEFLESLKEIRRWG